MVVALGHIKPVVGDVNANSARHLEFIKAAAQKGANLIIFPELSLTGYEPKLAKTLAMDLQDPRLDTFQTVSDENNISVGVGLPTLAENGIYISLVFLQPGVARKAYSKHFLHADEQPYFVAGENCALSVGETKVALAICYELSVEAHVTKSFSNKPDLYISSVAKTKSGVGKSLEQLAETAIRYSTITMMCNSVGFQDGEECWGTSSAWNGKGELIGQLDHGRQGILFVDLEKVETNYSYF